MSLGIGVRNRYVIRWRLAVRDGIGLAGAWAICGSDFLSESSAIGCDTCVNSRVSFRKSNRFNLHVLVLRIHSGRVWYVYV